MEAVATWLRGWARRKAAGGGGVRFIVSDASEPGEGEHK
jgi:5'-3' exonuclease